MFNNDTKETRKPNPFEKKPPEPPRKAKAPCPRCGSWNTIVENRIFVCLDCDYEGG